MIRKSIRKKGYDYSSEGHYFVTICTHFKEHTLAAIHENEITLTANGRILQLCWESIYKNFKSIRRDAFTVMPNHVHGILHLTETGTVALDSVIQNFKSVSTRRINNVRKTPGEMVWQQNYFERIIRTERELSLVRLYILLNPMLWHEHSELAEINLTEEKISKLLEKYRK